MKLTNLLTPLVMAVLGFAAQCASAADPVSLRIGYQKGSIALVLAKEHHLLEGRFPNTDVHWVEFPAGPQMLEALNVNSLDLASTGDIPPLFAQAAGADLVYVGAEPAKPAAETLLVPTGSPITTVAELKGRKVALQKGSSSHNLVLRALAKAGLSFSDITPVYLSPADAHAAFDQGSIDAWAIWDPYASLTLAEGKARLLVNGEGLGLNGPIYTARRSYDESHHVFIEAVLNTVSQAEALTRSEREQSLNILTRSMGLPREVVARYMDNRPPSPIGPVTPEMIATQQQTADLFYGARLLPRPLKVSDVSAR